MEIIKPPVNQPGDEKDLVPVVGTCLNCCYIIKGKIEGKVIKSNKVWLSCPICFSNTFRWYTKEDKNFNSLMKAGRLYQQENKTKPRSVDKTLINQLVKLIKNDKLNDRRALNAIQKWLDSFDYNLVTDKTKNKFEELEKEIDNSIHGESNNEHQNDVSDDPIEKFWVTFCHGQITNTIYKSENYARVLEVAKQLAHKHNNKVYILELINCIKQEIKWVELDIINGG